MLFHLDPLQTKTVTVKLFWPLFAIHLGTKEINILQLCVSQLSHGANWSQKRKGRNSLTICITFVQGFTVHLNTRTETIRAYHNMAPQNKVTNFIQEANECTIKTPTCLFTKQRNILININTKHNPGLCTI